MNEYLASAVIYAVFLAASLFFRKMMIKVRSPWMVVLCTVVYFVVTDVYFELVNKAHQVLRDHQIYIEFGHGAILRLAVFAICLLTGIIFIFSIIFTRTKARESVNSDNSG